MALFGDTLVVGAREEDSNATVGGNQGSNSASNSGAVYVFRRDDTSWAQEQYVKASNTDKDDLYGTAVALSEDTLVVGAAREDSFATGINGNQTDNSAANAGAVYLYQ